MNHPIEHHRQFQNRFEAFSELHRLDSLEPTVADFETVAASQSEIGSRTRLLLDLTTRYRDRFGVHFEMRHHYRCQLLDVVDGNTDSIEQAREIAFRDYTTKAGAGLPRLMELVRGRRIDPMN